MWEIEIQPKLKLHVFQPEFHLTYKIHISQN